MRSNPQIGGSFSSPQYILEYSEENTMNEKEEFTKKKLPESYRSLMKWFFLIGFAPIIISIPVVIFFILHQLNLVVSMIFIYETNTSILPSLNVFFSGLSTIAAAYVFFKLYRAIIKRNSAFLYTPFMVFSLIYAYAGFLFGVWGPFALPMVFDSTETIAGNVFALHSQLMGWLPLLVLSSFLYLEKSYRFK